MTRGRTHWRMSIDNSPFGPALHAQRMGGQVRSPQPAPLPRIASGIATRSPGIRSPSVLPFVCVAESLVGELSTAGPVAGVSWPHWHGAPPLSPAAFTIAMMPAWAAFGSSSQRSTTARNSGEFSMLIRQ